MPQVCPAARALHFGPPHKPAIVSFLLDVRRLDRRPEAGPAGARVILGSRVEQRRAAADAGIDARGLAVGILAGEGALGALLACDAILLRRQLLPPLRIRFLYALGHIDNSLEALAPRITAPA